MKISQTWLQEWLPEEKNARQWADKLAMSGFEIASIQKAAPIFRLIVVGSVVQCEKHPNADRLSLCQVDVGQEKPLSIICGAPNVCKGQKVVVALMGAELPNGMKVKRTKLRGVISEGMICSAKELGLTDDDCSGILVLDKNAKVGEDFRAYWNLDDDVVDLEITPNRGDCLSMQGVAREVAAVEQVPYHPLKVNAISPTIADTRKVLVKEASAAPRYVGRVIRNIDASVATPVYIKERLRRCGLRSINVVVDVLNYVMLEIGQPMHAFDLAHLTGDIIVRYAKNNEEILLLDNTTVTLNESTLVIADSREPCAIAGIMGGLDTGVTLKTKDIFLESAFFSPEYICRSTQQYGLHSDSSYRFERGVDSALQVTAIERATELLYPLIGGDVGPVIECVDKQHLPKNKTVTLRTKRIADILGITIDSKTIKHILQALHLSVIEEAVTKWQVTIPSYRFDIEQEIDLIEEIIRLYGYDHIERRNCYAEITQLNAESQKRLTRYQLSTTLVNRGYNEIVTYSFVDKGLHSLLTADEQAIRLSNPLNTDMAFMRTSLWPGLIKTAIYNQNRQMEHIRLFETGLCFKMGLSEEIIQVETLGGLIMGQLYTSQWGSRARDADFFDVKGDVEALFHLTHRFDSFSFKPCEHEILYSSQSAALYDGDRHIGYIGALHPTLIKQLKLTSPLYLFELSLDSLTQKRLPVARMISKYPSVRRDIALIVDRTILAEEIRQFIKEQLSCLVDVYVFDQYIGGNVPKDQQSIAFRLTFCDISRTLREQEINDQLSKLVLALQHQFKAILRGSS
jgi:phenylalanyl-tRNA synthetase beta chain